MAIAQSLQPRIVAVMKKTRCAYVDGRENVQRAAYDFYIHLGEVPSRHEASRGGTIISVKRIPGIFSEMADAFPDAREKSAWTRFGRIEYELPPDNGGIGAITSYYHPKDYSEGVKCPDGKLFSKVKRLGYYLDSIATSHVAREFGASAISTTTAPEPARRGHLKHVGLKVEAYFGSSKWGVREYLLGMGRGINEKVETARSSKSIVF